MYAAELDAAVVVAIIWMYLFFARGMFWRVGRALPSVSAATAFTGKIVAIIPARNEATVIGQSLESLARQSCSEELRLFVVDDASDDGTATVVRVAAAQCGIATNVITSAPLPPGWKGKLWAMQQAIAEAQKMNPDFFLLTDADILHAPDEIATLIAVAETGGYDLCSFMVKLHCESFAEKLLIPAFVYFFFMLYPPAWVRNRRRKIAGAAGGCMLVRPRALGGIGGIESIRSELIDDCALARAIKQSGGNVWLGLSAASQSLRKYTSFLEIGRMISRAAFNQLNHSTLLLAGTIVGMILTFLVPIALIGSAHAGAVVFGVTIWLVMAFSYSRMINFYEQNPLWSLLLPLAAMFYAGATVHSALAYWLGRGGEWKGRAQDVKLNATQSN